MSHNLPMVWATLKSNPSLWFVTIHHFLTHRTELSTFLLVEPSLNSVDRLPGVYVFVMFTEWCQYFIMLDFDNSLTRLRPSCCKSVPSNQIPMIWLLSYSGTANLHVYLKNLIHLFSSSTKLQLEQVKDSGRVILYVHKPTPCAR